MRCVTVGLQLGVCGIAIAGSEEQIGAPELQRLGIVIAALVIIAFSIVADVCIAAGSNRRRADAALLTRCGISSEAHPRDG